MTESNNFNFSNQQWREENANIIFSLLRKILPKINSVVDFGCGWGAWLAVLKQSGVNEIKGYDGAWTDIESLKIPKECFEVADLNKKISTVKRYDLAISIEVAEHITERSAKIFIETLAGASDIILFSAAIPYQRGRGHINLQWQNYWYNLFHESGYDGVDIRCMFWDDERIKTWYKQNIFLYVKKEKIKDIDLSEHKVKYINIVHPKTYLEKAAMNIEDITLMQLYKLCIKRTIKKIIGKEVLEKVKKIIKKNNGT